MSDEPAWRDLPFADLISTLRLRAAYGETGGQPPDAYGRFQNYLDVNYAGRPGFRAEARLGNPDLKPERQREYEAGLEAGLLGDRLSLELTYYDQRTSDLVLSVPVSITTGAQSQFQNIGVIRNRGIEGALNTVNVARPNFGWSSRLTFSANRNRVEELATSADTIATRYLNVVVEGQPVGVFYGRYYVRDDAGNIVYTPRTVTTFGKTETLLLPTVATGANGTPLQKILGDPNPDWVASLGNTFTVGRSLELSFLLDGRFGNDIWNGSRRILELFGAAKVVEREISGDTVFRTFSLNPAGRSLLYEAYIEDGSFVKLREVALQYRIGENIARRFGVGGMNLRVAGRNLYTWTDYTGLDPEVNLFSANTVARGVDFGTTPIPRTLVVGIDFFF